MDVYYELLGLEPGASQTEIKKAYFKMVRQYSPESNPEQFQKIREAYETLKNVENRSEQLIFPPLQDDFAKKMLAQIDAYRRMGEIEKCRDCCEEAYKRFPKELQFLYLLVIAQLQCGNTGKAVKNAELLTAAEPNNKWFQRELATAYTERGYTKKAYEACVRAYELGCRDIDFVLMYSLDCNSHRQYKKGLEILLEVIRREKRWSRDEMIELLEAYAGAFRMNREAASAYFDELTEKFCKYLKQYGIYLKEYQQELHIMICCIQPESDSEYQKVEQIFKIMEEIFRTDSEKAFLNEIRQELICDRIMHDPRIELTLKHGYEAYRMYVEGEYSSPLQKFALTDIQLCMIEEREKILQQEEMIQTNYPDYYEYIKDFLQKLKANKDIAYLKSRLQKEYQRMEPDFAGGYYYELYPEERRKAKGRLISDEMGEEPYVRGEKKIGRNEPCPCGSGKKYKHCCMNKK